MFTQSLSNLTEFNRSGPMAIVSSQDSGQTGFSKLSNRIATQWCLVCVTQRLEATSAIFAQINLGAQRVRD